MRQHVQYAIFVLQSTYGCAHTAGFQSCLSISLCTQKLRDSRLDCCTFTAQFCCLQVVNRTELSRLGDAGVPFFGINLSVGLSLALPGFQTDMAKGLLNNMPFGAITLVGAKSHADAVQARQAGADAVLLKREMLAVKGQGQSRQDVKQILEQLKYSMSGDD